MKVMKVVSQVSIILVLVGFLGSVSFAGPIIPGQGVLIIDGLIAETDLSFLTSLHLIIPQPLKLGRWLVGCSRLL